MMETSTGQILPQKRLIRVIEWFSGIGGWSFALRRVEEACHQLRFQVIAAIDINPVANDVYSRNLDITPTAKSIESLNLLFFERHPTELWVLSPPCQPFTRNHEISPEDNRTQALDHIIRILQQLHDSNSAFLPEKIALENVVGFETSSNCAALKTVLTMAEFKYEEYILTPTQVGVPNERPRYFLIASRTACELGGNDFSIATNLPNGTSRKPVPLDAYLDDTSTTEAALQLSDELLSKPSSWCMDIVNRESTTSACFTKAYSRYMKGTGSILIERQEPCAAAAVDASDSTTLTADEGLAGSKRCFSEHSSSSQDAGVASTATDPSAVENSAVWRDGGFLSDPSQRKFETDWKSKYVGCRFRYFSPRELLNLFGFPNEFTFPPTLTNRKCYELIGNSINVVVAAELLTYLFNMSNG